MWIVVCCFISQAKHMSSWCMTWFICEPI
uniref:Uncharacterized protein n=1 Tax=Arundo donax TaxID=35708 RepID=A0A0A8YUX9_ARUDO